MRDFLLAADEEGGFHVAEDDGDAARWGWDGEKGVPGGFGAEARALLQSLVGFNVVEELARGLAEVVPLIEAVAVSLRARVVWPLAV